MSPPQSSDHDPPQDMPSKALVPDLEAQDPVQHDAMDMPHSSRREQQSSPGQPSNGLEMNSEATGPNPHTTSPSQLGVQELSLREPVKELKTTSTATDSVQHGALSNSPSQTSDQQPSANSPSNEPAANSKPKKQTQYDVLIAAASQEPLRTDGTMEYHRVSDRREFATSKAPHHGLCSTNVECRPSSGVFGPRALQFTPKNVGQAHQSPLVRRFISDSQMPHDRDYDGVVLWKTDRQSRIWREQMERPRTEDGRLMIEPDKVPQGSGETDCRIGWEALRLSMGREQARRDRLANRSTASTQHENAMELATPSHSPIPAGEQQPITATEEVNADSEGTQNQSQPDATRQRDERDHQEPDQPGHARVKTDSVFKKPGLPASANKRHRRESIPAMPFTRERSISPAAAANGVDPVAAMTPVSLPGLPPLGMAKVMASDYMHKKTHANGNAMWPLPRWPTNFEHAASKVKQWRPESHERKSRLKKEAKMRERRRRGEEYAAMRDATKEPMAAAAAGRDPTNTPTPGPETPERENGLQLQRTRTQGSDESSDEVMSHGRPETEDGDGKAKGKKKSDEAVSGSDRKDSTMNDGDA